MSDQPIADSSPRDDGRGKGLQNSSGRLLGAVNHVVWVLRAPLAVALLSFAFFYFPEQIREIYRALAADFVEASFSSKAVLACLGVSLLSVFLWVLCRSLWAVSAADQPQPPTRVDHAVFAVASTIIALLPLAGVILAIARIRLYEFADVLRWSTQFEGLPKDLEADFARIVENVDAVKGLLTSSLILLLVVAGGLVALSVLRRAPGSAKPGTPYAPWKLLLAIIVTAGLVTLTAFQPYISQGGSLVITRAFMEIGTIFIISVFLILLAYFFGAGSRFYDRRGIPVLTLLVAIGIVLSYFNLNDNHKVKFGPTQAGHRVEVLTERFANWFDALPAARKQLYASRGEKYPVYIVAAQGGGLYAANLTALALARIYSLCPALKHHIFAVSSVSGGSLGASVFNALWAEQAASGDAAADDAASDCRWRTEAGDNPLERRISAYLGEDFLAPLAAGSLFPDFLQRFIYPAFDGLDRARAFEAGLSEAWRATASDGAAPTPDPFTGRFLDFSSRINNAPLWAPTLVLNSTNVETGKRYLVTPALFSKDDVVTSLYSLDTGSLEVKNFTGEDLTISRDISLATAVSLSSRFPLVLPPGVYLQPAQAYRFVDGGYFENSGIETAIDMKSSIEERLANPTMRTRLASVRSLSPSLAGARDAAAQIAAATSPPVSPEFRIIILSENYVLGDKLDGLNEIGAPLRTLNRTRLRRGELAKLRAEKTFAKRYIIELQHSYFPMPLGWQLSRHTQSMIKTQIGQPGECERNYRLRLRDEKMLEGVQGGGGAQAFVRLADRLISNRCTLRDIIEELEPVAGAAEPAADPASTPGALGTGGTE